MGVAVEFEQQRRDMSWDIWCPTPGSGGTGAGRPKKSRCVLGGGEKRHVGGLWCFEIGKILSFSLRWALC